MRLIKLKFLFPRNDIPIEHSLGTIKICIQMYSHFPIFPFPGMMLFPLEFVNV